MRALIAAALMLIGVGHGSIWNSADHIGHNDIGFCVESAVSGPLIDEIANGGMVEFVAIRSAIYNAGDYFKYEVAASPFAHVDGPKIHKWIRLRGEYSRIAILRRRIMVVGGTQSIAFRRCVESIGQNENIVVKTEIYRRGLPKILHDVVDLGERMRWPQRPEGSYIELHPRPSSGLHFVQLQLGDIALGLHYFRLPRINRELQRPNDNEGRSEEEAPDNGEPIQEGVVAGAISIIALCLSGLMVWLGDSNRSMKIKRCLQGLGLLLMIATPVIAIIGSYWVVHGDFGIFSM